MASSGLRRASPARKRYDSCNEITSSSRTSSDNAYNFPTSPLRRRKGSFMTEKQVRSSGDHVKAHAHKSIVGKETTSMTELRRPSTKLQAGMLCTDHHHYENQRLQRSDVKTDMLCGPATRRPSPLTQFLKQNQRIPSDNERAPPRMLVSITLLGSIWEVRLVVSAHETVKDLINAALAAYSRDGRLLSSGFHAQSYELYFSQFSLQCLNEDAKIMDLGARSFALRSKREALK